MNLFKGEIKELNCKECGKKLPTVEHVNYSGDVVEESLYCNQHKQKPVK